MKQLYFMIAIAGLLAVACNKETPESLSNQITKGTYIYTLNA